MFRSFFPNPKWFFSSAALWAALCIFVWYSFNESIGAFIGLDLSPQAPVVGLGFFVTDEFLLL
ncbi:MAG: peptide transporter, partial [Gammaproteobacteria bacterium]|nr:peptide transporter [Gammaproteobacteria bacterium]